MEYNLFLDDIRDPSQAADYMPKDVSAIYRTRKWVIVRNHDDFVRILIDYGLPKIVSFDHDLADIHYDPDTHRETFEYYPETGYDSMKWMIEYMIDNELEPPVVLVHSQNPVGAENIKTLFDNFLKQRRCHSKESNTPMDK